jgi:hypothetical protein
VPSPAPKAPASPTPEPPCSRIWPGRAGPESAPTDGVACISLYARCSTMRPPASHPPRCCFWPCLRRTPAHPARCARSARTTCAVASTSTVAASATSSPAWTGTASRSVSPSASTVPAGRCTRSPAASRSGVSLPCRRPRSARAGRACPPCPSLWITRPKGDASVRLPTKPQLNKEDIRVRLLWKGDTQVRQADTQVRQRDTQVRQADTQVPHSHPVTYPSSIKARGRLSPTSWSRPERLRMRPC